MKKHFLFSLISVGMLQAQTLPPEAEVKGNYEQKDGWIVALPVEKGVSTTITGSLPGNEAAFILRGKLGANGMRIALNDDSGKFIPIGTSKLPLNLKPWDTKAGKINLPAHAIAMSGLRYFVRPNPMRLGVQMAELRFDEWQKMPDATQYPFTLEMRPTADEKMEIWMDGHFLRRFDWPKEAVSFSVGLHEGAALESIQLEPVAERESLTLPMQAMTETEKRVTGHVEFTPGVEISEAFCAFDGQSVEGVEVGGLGDVRGLRFDDLQSAFWHRHASDRLEGQKMFAVPLATWRHAQVLCAAKEQDDRVNSFVFRVTRYAESRGNAMADSVVEVPLKNADGTSNATRVGTVTVDSEPLGLWLVTVPIKNGLIQDLLYDDKRSTSNFSGGHEYLDIELLDPLHRIEEADAFPPSLGLVQRSWRPTELGYKSYDYFRQKEPPLTSSAIVFGIVLEKSPAEMTVRANTGFQVFYESDKPELIANVMARKSGDYKVVWDFADLDGRIVTSSSEVFQLEAGAEKAIHVPIRESAGWYAARFRLLLGDDELLDSRTTFVVLPPDTRKAGLESPFVGWWFRANQRSDVKLDEAGPLLQRLGIRRVEKLSDDMPESESLKYGLTQSTIQWGIPGGGKETLQLFGSHQKKLPEVIAQLEETIRGQLEKWPLTDRMNVFHESRPNGAPFPSEIYGIPARLSRVGFEDENSPEALMRREAGEESVADRWSEKDQADWKRSWPLRMQYIEAMVKMVREKFPQLKLQYGNDGNSLRIVGEIFRQKFPREYIDTIAIEDLGQTITPESPMLGNAHSAWYLREVARKMGYGDVPLTACTEWIGRMTERLGLQTQAEWKVRDGLIALAYGFDTISIAGLNDASSGYYHSIWANGGLCYRHPTMAPKPAYLAVATLTQILDRTEFQRFVSTGSTVLHVQEFRRGDDWVYAIWTPRGTRETTLEFAGNAGRILTDLYGRETKLSGKSHSLTAGTAVQYLTSGEQIQSVTAGRSTFPEDPRPPEEVETVIPLESLAEVSIVSDKGKEKKYSLREGEFELREVEDPEMGKCLELELKPTAPLQWDMEKEYVYLKLTQPLRTEAKNAGVWIKGNGGWGEIDIWKTRPWGPWANNRNLHFNWPSQGKLNFEGWNFITFPYYDWVRENADRPAQNAVQGLYLTMPRKTIHGVETVPVENLKIRLKSIILF